MSSQGATRIALVACAKLKLHQPAAAEDLYVSDLFRSMRGYAEMAADDWFVLSAEHGLVHRSQMVAPYDRTLTTMRKADRQAWSLRVQAQLREALAPGATVIVLAGQRYREGLVEFLRGAGFLVEIPLRGKPLGIQLQWLKREISEASDRSRATAA